MTSAELIEPNSQSITLCNSCLIQTAIFSPSGQLLAYYTEPGSNSDERQLQIINTETGEKSTVETLKNSRIINTIKWRDDSSALAYVEFTPQSFEPNEDYQPDSKVYVYDVLSSKSSEITLTEPIRSSKTVPEIIGYNPTQQTWALQVREVSDTPKPLLIYKIFADGQSILALTIDNLDGLTNLYGYDPKHDEYVFLRFQTLSRKSLTTGRTTDFNLNLSNGYALSSLSPSGRIAILLRQPKKDFLVIDRDNRKAIVRKIPHSYFYNQPTIKWLSDELFVYQTDYDKFVYNARTGQEAPVSIFGKDEDLSSIAAVYYQN